MDTSTKEASRNCIQKRSRSELATEERRPFRILLAGNAGAGKTDLANTSAEGFGCLVGSLVDDHQSTDSESLISTPVSAHNEEFILLESKGLETGSDTNSWTILRFLQGRRARSPLDEQVHAIWYCVEIPLGGEHLFEGGEIKLLKEIRDTNPNISLVVVFTKLDRLEFREKQRLKKEYKEKGLSLQEATDHAREEYVEAAKKKYTDSCLKPMEDQVAVLRDWARCTFVSIKQKNTIKELIELTKTMLTSSQQSD